MAIKYSLWKWIKTPWRKQGFADFSVTKYKHLISFEFQQKSLLFCSHQVFPEGLPYPKMCFYPFYLLARCVWVPSHLQEESMPLPPAGSTLGVSKILLGAWASPSDVSSVHCREGAHWEVVMVGNSNLRIMEYPELKGTHRITEIQLLWFILNDLNYPIFYHWVWAGSHQSWVLGESKDAERHQHGQGWGGWMHPHWGQPMSQQRGPCPSASPQPGLPVSCQQDVNGQMSHTSLPHSAHNLSSLLFFLFFSITQIWGR